MLILLPPSESKRAGGRGSARLRLDSLRFPELLEQREQTAHALVELARGSDPEAAAKALGIPRTLAGELQSDALLFESPVMPAIDRYTGVLYDALDAATLPAEARRHLARTVAIHSAVFGPVGALDRIPDYRMSATSRIPGIRLRSLWAPAVTSALGSVQGPVIDLRSEGYVALGPLRSRPDAVFVRVVSETPDGIQRALNHFNKHAKGMLVRAFALQRPRVRSLDGFVQWARSAGFRMESAADHEVRLVVS
ncbi:YaaA family protein [Rathayibacter sp. KR2-224]|uniref:YaaA family protein n=1 Tax=Rathayibacter sp. KR2-224 TaxID=3400913 RepID=UPI003C0D5D5A